MIEKETAPQGCPEIITLEFISKGLPGPTIDIDVNTFLIEIHHNENKYLIQIPRGLAAKIPSFSILKLI